MPAVRSLAASSSAVCSAAASQLVRSALSAVGCFAALHPAERDLYFLLLVAADRNGVSFYHYDSICSLLELTLESYLGARNALIDKDLIAFDGTRFQVLSLPDKPRFDNPAPLVSDDDRTDRDPATIRKIVRQSIGTRRREMP